MGYHCGEDWSLLEPRVGATDLSVQVDICNTVQGKLVSVSPVLVDVGDGQTGQLPHRFVIAGYGREFDGRQGKAVGARQITARQKKAGEQQRYAAGRVAHGCTGRETNRQREEEILDNSFRTECVQSEVCSPVLTVSPRSDFWNQNRW